MQIPTWGYKFIPFAIVGGSNEFEDKLNDAGKDGFQFAGAFGDDPNSAQAGGVILARPTGYVEIGSGLSKVAVVGAGVKLA